MCIVKIDHWYARYGNNIMQVAHCCDYSFEKRNAYKIIFPSHLHFTKTEILNPNENVCICNTVIKNDEFFSLLRMVKSLQKHGHTEKRYCKNIVCQSFRRKLQKI
jgi:hypothetical protein